MKKIKCNYCNEDVYPVTCLQAYAGGSHIRADCPYCGRWIKWLPKGTEVTGIKFVRPTLENIKK